MAKATNKIVHPIVDLEPEFIDNKTIQYPPFEKYVWFVVFLVFIGIIYIAYTNRAENTRRKINKYQQELKELKWRYAESHSQLMRQTKQSEVAQKADTLGLKILTSPPIQLVVESNKK